MPDGCLDSLCRRTHQVPSGRDPHRRLLAGAWSRLYPGGRKRGKTCVPPGPPEEMRRMAQEGKETATHPYKAPAYMAEAVLGFNEQVERIGEVAVVVLLAGVLAMLAPAPELLWLVPVLR